jgi:hypothetical protein
MMAAHLFLNNSQFFIFSEQDSLKMNKLDSPGLKVRCKNTCFNYRCK